MHAPPGKRRPLSRCLLTGLVAFCGSASAEVAITNTFSPSTVRVSSQTTYSFNISTLVAKSADQAGTASWLKRETRVRPGLSPFSQ
ncbi:hypothetical protein, partial [Deinococcus sp. S9]|uniref:hypothetical protein n=1 Tax=Deinococcus sp. S9 TaxID=2545754 RepID=UPI001981C746